jgi:hypothetical protein
MAAIKIFVIGLACIVVGVEMADIIQFLGNGAVSGKAP